ncbi:MAG: GNAT family N-acetyltransferase [Armatimonadota bacterium]
MANAAAIADLLNAAWAEAAALPRVVAPPVEMQPWTPEKASSVLEAAADGVFTVERDGLPVNLLTATAEADGVGYLSCLATHPAYRRQGLATDCLSRALDFLKSRGLTRVETGYFTDSRVTSACAFLEARGFTVREPERQNIVMQIDMNQYEPVPIVLPEGFRIETLRPESIPQYLQTKDRVFGGTTAPDWFEKTFSHRWDFEWDGWLTLWRGEEMIGLSGADLFRDPDHPETYSGAQIEYVGVVEGFRGLRLGEMLVRACLNYIKDLQVKPCQLITQPFRVPAVTLYERLGFRLVRENRTYEMTL